MLLLLALVLWITVYGANYPSELLFSAFDALGVRLRQLLSSLNAPEALTGALIDGVYRVLSWVVAVMLPPMAIFFPLLPCSRTPDICRGSPLISTTDSKIRRLREAGSDYVHGLRLQRRRGDGLPHNRLSPRASHGGGNERFCALQRQISDADIADLPVCRRRSARSV